MKIHTTSGGQSYSYIIPLHNLLPVGAVTFKSLERILSKSLIPC